MNDENDPRDRAWELTLEQLRAQSDLRLAEYNSNTQRSLEVFKAGIGAGREAVRAITLLNGSGAVAMLAFVGNLASKSEGVDELRLPLFLFVLGAFLSVLASALNYFAQGCVKLSLRREFQAINKTGPELENVKHSETRWRRGFIFVNVVTILCAALALGCFGAGAYSGYHGLKKVRPVERVTQFKRTTPFIPLKDRHSGVEPLALTWH